MKKDFLARSSSISFGWYGFAVIVIAFCIRAAVLHWYVAPGHYYIQPDSNDYHASAMSIVLNGSMTYIQTGQPIFWRTPGYPLFLAPWYWWYGISSYSLRANDNAQQAALWVQVVLSSLIPYVVMQLAFVLTATAGLSLLAGIITALHPGFVLASTFLLTEGAALLFYVLFLVCFFKMLIRPTVSWWLLIGAVLSLSVFAWMRPMGECIAVMASLLLLCVGSGSWRKTIVQSVLFVTLFFATLAPWYVRNYALTGELFFCPTFGIYCNAFCVPKIVARLDNTTFKEAWEKSQKHAHEIIVQRYIASRSMVVSPTWIKDACIPIVMAHPFYFAWDWVVQVCKTTFDLYTYQLVSIENNTHESDPLIEYLSEKISTCLFCSQTPLYVRIIGFIELVFMICIWVGLLSGMYHHIVKHIMQGNWSALRSRESIIWLSAALLSMFVVGLSGGFGYARLRLPIEPLLIILGMYGLTRYIPKTVGIKN